MEYYTIGENVDGATFEPQNGFSLEPDPDPEVVVSLGDPHPEDDGMDGDDDDGCWVTRIRCANRLLFILLENGLIAVLDWRKKMIIHLIKYYYKHPLFDWEEFPKYQGEEGMLVKQGKLVMAVKAYWNLPADIIGPAELAVWEFDDGKTQAFSAQLISEIRHVHHRHVWCFDLDAHLLVYGLTSGDVIGIFLWDVSQNALLRKIHSSAPVRCFLSLSAKTETLLLVKWNRIYGYVNRDLERFEVGS